MRWLLAIIFFLESPYLTAAVDRMDPNLNRPAWRDTDGDGVPDQVEVMWGLNPYEPTDGLSDEDEDGLTWAEEWAQGTQVKKSDTDGDGVNDGDEVKVWGTNPLIRNAKTDFTPKMSFGVAGPPRAPLSAASGRTFTPSWVSGDWNGSNLVPVGDWTLERGKMKDYAGWMPKHGRYLKIWREGQREVVELDARGGDSFGMMRAYPNPRAGSYILLWEDSVRAGVSAQSARYQVRVMGDASNVLGQWKCDPPAGNWRSQHLVFNIPASLVPNQLWIHFETEDNDGQGAFVQEVRLIKLGVELDVNRDGTIAQEERPQESAWEFWVNDDYDRAHMVDGNDQDEEDLGMLEAAKLLPDWKSDKINSLRDLEDFFRCQLSLEGDVESFAAGDLFLGLRFQPHTASQPWPAMKLFRMTNPDSGAYLQQEAEAEVQVKEGRVVPDLNPAVQGTSLVDATHVMVLPRDVWVRGKRTATFLAEACAEGGGRLTLSVVRRRGVQFEVLAEIPTVSFNFYNIKQRYEHWSAGNENGGAPLSQPVRLTATLYKNANGGRVMNDRPCLVFVHGWNMEVWEKERYAETAFKRLWWSGYNGNFVLFSWPCTNGFSSNLDAVTSPTNYDRGEFSAWRSAECLRQFLEDCSVRYGGRLYLLAHSMGNIVTGEALRLQWLKHGPALAKVYVASQAAVSAHCYDGSLSDRVGSKYALPWYSTLPKFAWLGKVNFGPDTPNVYRDWFADLLSSQGRSAPVVGKLINFYNQNDWALSDAIWCYNQLSKPDWADRPYQPWNYDFEKPLPRLPTEPFAQAFVRSQGRHIESLRWGSPAELKDNYEIMAFAAESYVRPLGACELTKGVTASVDLEKLWPVDAKQHSTHKWHSAQFRSCLMRQKGYWMRLAQILADK